MKINKRELFKRYSLEVLKTNDLAELQNLFDYCSGLIIKNAPLADANETKVSEKNSSTYLKAYRGIDENNPVQREKLIKMYQESNKYYKALYDEYGIEPYVSRMAEDFDILTSTTKYYNNTLTLDNHQENLFLSCYKEGLTYFNNVIRNKSFQNEDTYREFIEVYLIFIAINRYISKRMFDQFNVDTFTKYQCKNYFISNGTDYFDDLPLEMQRRLIKLLNDLQLNKGDDIAFDLIKKVLQTDSLHIYRYTLVRTNDNDLQFYKVPYEEELNPDSNEIYTFEAITGGDPYWRASKNEVLAQKFNVLETKYISVEYAVDILKNSYATSYFTNMLNELEIDNKENGLASAIAFRDEEISGNKISLHDAFQALYCLFLMYITNNYTTGDSIDIPVESDPNSGIYKMVDSLKNIYGYKRYYSTEGEINELVDEILDYIYKDIEDQKEKYGEVVNPYSNELALLEDRHFALKNYYTSQSSSFTSIENEYYRKSHSSQNSIISGMSAKDEFLILAKFIIVRKIQNPYNREDNIYNLVVTDQLYEALIFLCQLIFTNSLEIQYLSIHRSLCEIFKKFMSFLIINGHLDDIKYYKKSQKERDELDRLAELLPDVYNITDKISYNSEYDIFYNYMINNEAIMTDLVNYVNKSYGVDNVYLVNFLGLKDTEEGPEAFLTMFMNLPNFYTNEKIDGYRNLKTFIYLLTSFEKIIYIAKPTDGDIDGIVYSTVTKNYFNSAYKENEQLRADLENAIYECQDKEVHRRLRKLWYLTFMSNYYVDLIKDFKLFRDYLKVNSPDLYTYVVDINEDDPRKDVEDKILNLTDKMQKYLGSYKYIITDSTINVLFAKYKLFAEILIEAFKAYTLDTIYADNVIEVKDKFSNYIKIFDEIEIEDLEFTMLDYLDIHDSVYDKDNGEFDFMHRLMIQNVVVASNEEGTVVVDEDLEDIVCDVYIFESKDELPNNGFKIETTEATGFNWFPFLIQNNLLLENEETINDRTSGVLFTVPYSDAHPGIVSDITGYTFRIAANRSRMIDINRDKNYLIYGVYSCKDVIDYQLKKHGYDSEIEKPIKILEGNDQGDTGWNFLTDSDKFTSGKDNLLAEMPNIIRNYQGYNFVVIVDKGDSYNEIMFYDMTLEDFVSIGCFYGYNYFNMYYETNQRFNDNEHKLIVDPEDVKMVYHRKYWDAEYINSLNSDSNPYNDVISVREGGEVYHRSGVGGPPIYEDTENSIDWIASNALLNHGASSFIMHNKYNPTDLITTKGDKNKPNNTSDIVTFTAGLIKPDQSTKLTIKISDTFNGTSRFGFIALKNKGITDYSSKATDNVDPKLSNRPFLAAIKKLNNDYNFGLNDGEDFNNLTEVANIVNKNNYSDFVRDENLTGNEVYHCDCYKTDDGYLDYIKMRTEIQDENNESDLEVRRNIRANENGTFASFVYDYNECNSYNETEEVLDYGLVEPDENGNCFETLFNTTRVMIFDKDHNLVYSNFNYSSNNSVMKPNFELYNHEETINDPESGDENIKREEEYYLIINSGYINVPTFNGNFLFNIDLDRDATSENKCYGIEIEEFESNTSDYDKGLRYLYGNDKSLTKFYKIKPVDKECHIGFKMTGIITFEYIINYKNTNDKAVIFQPEEEFSRGATGARNTAYYNGKGIKFFKNVNPINLQNDSIYLSSNDIRNNYYWSENNNKYVIVSYTEPSIKSYWMATANNSTNSYQTEMNSTNFKLRTLLDSPLSANTSFSTIKMKDGEVDVDSLINDTAIASTIDNYGLCFNTDNYSYDPTRNFNKFLNSLCEFLNIDPTEDINFIKNYFKTRSINYNDREFESDYKFNFEVLNDNELALAESNGVDYSISSIKDEIRGIISNYDELSNSLQRKILYVFISEKIRSASQGKDYMNNNYSSKITVRYGKDTITIPGCPRGSYITNNDMQKIMISNRYINSIDIPSDIESIDNHAFINSWISKILIPPFVYKVGSYAFYNSRLKHLYFQNNEYILRPSEIDELGNINFNLDTFEDLNFGLRYYDSSNRIKNHGYLVVDSYAFSRTRFLHFSADTVFMPFNLSTLEGYTFEWSNIVGINFDRCVHFYSIGRSAFNGCVYLGRRYIKTSNQPVINQNNGFYIFENEFSYPDQDTLGYLTDVITGSVYTDENENPIFDFNSYDSYYENVDYFGNGNIKNNYEFSISKPLIMPFGENYSFITIDRYAFRECQFLRLFDGGNIYHLPYASISNCYRLSKVMLPEVRFVGTDNIIYETSNLNFFVSDFYLNDNGNKIHSYRDTLTNLDDFDRDDELNLVPKPSSINTNKIRIIFNNYSYIIKKKSKSDGTISSITADDLMIDGVDSPAKRTEFNNNYVAVFEDNDNIEHELTIKPNHEIIQNGYSALIQEKYRSNIVISRVFENCNSLLTVDFSTKLESIMAFSFLSTSSLFRNNDNIFIIMNTYNDINGNAVLGHAQLVGSVSAFDTNDLDTLPYTNKINGSNTESLPRFSMKYLKDTVSDPNYNKFNLNYINSGKNIQGYADVFFKDGGWHNVGKFQYNDVFNYICDSVSYYKCGSINYNGPDSQWQLVNKSALWNAIEFVHRYNTAQSNWINSITDYVKSTEGFNIIMTNNINGITVEANYVSNGNPESNSIEANLSSNYIQDSIDINNLFDSKYQYYLTMAPQDNVSYHIPNSDQSLSYKSSKGLGNILYSISNDLKNKFENDSLYELVQPLNDNRSNMGFVPFTNGNYFSQQIKDNEIYFDLDSNGVCGKHYFTDSNESDSDFDMYAYRVHDIIEKIKNNDQNLDNFEMSVKYSYDNFNNMLNEINSYRDTVTEKIGIANSISSNGYRWDNYLFYNVDGESSVNNGEWNNEVSSNRRLYKDDEILQDLWYSKRSYGSNNELKDNYFNDLNVLYTKKSNKITVNENDIISVDSSSHPNIDLSDSKKLAWKFKIQSRAKSQNDYYRYFIDIRQSAFDTYTDNFKDEATGYNTNREYYYSNITKLKNYNNDFCNHSLEFLMHLGIVGYKLNGYESFNVNTHLMSSTSNIKLVNLNYDSSERYKDFLIENNSINYFENNKYITPRYLYDNTYYDTTGTISSNTEYSYHDYNNTIIGNETIRGMNNLADKTTFYVYHAPVPRIGISYSPRYLSYNSQNSNDEKYSFYKHLLLLPGKLFDRINTFEMMYNVPTSVIRTNTNDGLFDNYTNMTSVGIVSSIHSIILDSTKTNIIGYEINGMYYDNISGTDYGDDKMTSNVVCRLHLYDSWDNITDEVRLANYTRIDKEYNSSTNITTHVTYQDVLDSLKSNTVIQNNKAYIRFHNGTRTIDISGSGTAITLNGNSYLKFS